MKIIATRYTLPWSRFNNVINKPWMNAEIEARNIDDNGNPKAWCVICGSSVLSKDGKWEFEPNPSGRTDAFIKRTRWKTLEEAYAAAEKCFEPKPKKP